MSWSQLGNSFTGSLPRPLSDCKVIRNGLSIPIVLSADGTTVAVAYDYTLTTTGRVIVYKKETTGWVQRGSVISSTAVGSLFGYSISLSNNGETIAIGEPRYNSVSGRVTIYTWSGGDWVIMSGSPITFTNGAAGGYSVSLSPSGLAVAIGAPMTRRTGSGHVRVYTWEGNTWSQRGNSIYGVSATEFFGHSVSISLDGTVVSIGVPPACVPYFDTLTNNTAGYISIYEYNNISGWVKRGNDINGLGTDFAGYSVSLSADGSIVAFGSPGGSNYAGCVKIYEWTTTGWSQYGNTIDGEYAGDNAGYCISLSSGGTIVAVGAPNNDDNGNNCGKVSVYELSGGTWIKRVPDIKGVTGTAFCGLNVSLSESGTSVAIGGVTSSIGSFISKVYMYTPPAPICFLADAPILTPVGYRPISTIAVGDTVRTAAGRDVAVKRVFAKEYIPSTSANPYVIPKGMFSALRSLPISPNHEVMVAGRGMVKARDLGLQRMKMTGPFTYYNLELEDWARDNLVVAGVECESLAPAERIAMTKAEFLQFVKARYGHTAAARLRSVCFEEPDGRVSMPALH